MKKLIAINRFTFDGFSAREMLFKTGDAEFTLVGSSEAPDDTIDETPVTFDDMLLWLQLSADTTELLSSRHCD